MTIDRAIEIFDPDNPKTYKDAAEIEEAMRMAVEIMTRLKGVAPKIAWNGTIWWYECGGCGHEIDVGDCHCRYCGKAVKWDDDSN